MFRAMAHWFSIGGMKDALYTDGDVDVSVFSSSEFSSILNKLKDALLDGHLKSVRFNFPHIILIAKAKDKHNLSITKQLLDT
jgi:hypothetical protein